MSMLFDPRKVPFSRRERFLTLSVMEGALMLRSVRGGDLRPSLGRLARIALEDDAGVELVAELQLSPGVLEARAGGGRVRFAIGAGERLHVAGQGVRLALHLEGSRYDYAYRTPAGESCLVAAYENLRLMPRASAGEVEVTGQWRRDRSENVVCRFGGAGGFEGTVDLFTVTPPSASKARTEAVAREAEAEFAAFQSRFAPAREGGEEAHRLAAYLLWANTVPAGGMLSRPAVYMSKNAMINIWSWDNAFSALGLAAAEGTLAFDQFAAIYDRQDASGMLPDFVQDQGASLAFTKPPVHGWAIGLIADAVPGWLTTERADYLAEHLAAQVSWWLTATRAGQGTLPTYPHGNDSGWDNASFFDRGGPVASPDLPTFLILCCDALALLRPGETARWSAQGEELLRLMLDQLADEEGFGTRRLAEPERLERGQSLIRVMPLLLGDRLPRPLAERLVAQLREDHLTDWGPATEAPASPLYEADGYWRGPIWAPTTALVWDGLRRQGEAALAREVALRFCRLCEVAGMAENFDALAGRGLRDPGFAWTSAVYLMLTGWLREGA